MLEFCICSRIQYPQMFLTQCFSFYFHATVASHDLLIIWLVDLLITWLVNPISTDVDVEVVFLSQIPLIQSFLIYYQVLLIITWLVLCWFHYLAIWATSCAPAAALINDKYTNTCCDDAGKESHDKHGRHGEEATWTVKHTAGHLEDWFTSNGWGRSTPVSARCKQDIRLAVFSYLGISG